jgi:hypothetical protein
MTLKSRNNTDRSVNIRNFSVIPCPPRDVRQPIGYRNYGHRYLGCKFVILRLQRPISNGCVARPNRTAAEMISTPDGIR